MHWHATIVFMLFFFPLPKPPIALEFIYAQSPEKMRGLLTGLFYLNMGIFMCTGSLIVFFVQHPDLGLQTIPNPSLILSLIFAIVALLGLVFYAAAASKYKNRHRPGADEEDLQIHTYATMYYSRAPT